MRANTNVLDYLEQSAKTHAHSCAVVDEQGELSYADFRDACRRVGSALAARGMRGHGTVVAMEKGSSALIAQLGTLYAGGFYVPVDQDIPAQRLNQIVDTLGEALIVVDETTREHVASCGVNVEVVDFENLVNVAVDETALALVQERFVETDPAYVLFTSGSTGVPKGVVISHRAIRSFIDCFVETFGIRDTDRVGNQAPFDFDVSTKDIYSCLATGATLVIIPRRLFMEPVALASYLEQQQVSVLVWAVAALCIVSTYHAFETADFSRIRMVMFSGETMPKRHLKTWRAHLPQATFVNLYGPTEITCNCLYHQLDPEGSYDKGVPLGGSFAHCDVLVIDDEGHEVTTPDVDGELVVRGPSLALGYLAQPEQTKKAFDQNPLNDCYPDRVYHTGDLAAYDEQGQLFFRGRKDNQIKYQGHRIELEEIELAIEKLPGVDRCRCAFDEKRKLLHAFFEGTADERALPEQIHSTLPSHMQPVTIRRVDGMPLTAHGKVDRKALLASTKRTRRVR